MSTIKLIESMHWRYAVKKFDPTKKITPEDLASLKESIRLSPSSFGLQPYKCLIIENKEIRAKLKPVSWLQDQIVDASHLFLFCNYKKINSDYISAYLKLIAKTRSIELQKLEAFGNVIKNNLAGKTDQEMTAWTAKQAYIAMGNLINTCAYLHIDTCPIEGFEPDKYETILKLSDQNLRPAVVVAAGYRDETDGDQHKLKVRKENSRLFETV